MILEFGRYRPFAPACFSAFLWFSAVVVQPAGAAALPSGFTETKLIGSFNPTAIEIAPDGRLFICEKPGRVRVYKDGALVTAPLLTVDADFTEERGLLGIALDPDYAASPYVYIYYTVKNPAHNRVSRFRVDGDVATGAEQILLDLDPLTQVGWHNGGAIHFGKDGKLYIAAGNNVNQAYSQSIAILLGKVLRIDPDGGIPTDNPFYDMATGKNRAIWALGLRNPFSTAINPVTGRMFVHDVGDGSAEEINEGVSGSNYGYPKTEGHAATAPTGLTGPYHDPVSWYNHGDGCAITGGTFYHPVSNTFGAAYTDGYFFADYCGGWIKSLDPANGNAVKSFATGIARPIGLKAAPDGSLYYLCRGARAPGENPGSANDNSVTTDGSLFRIKGPIVTGLSNPYPARSASAGGRTLFAPLPGGRLELAAGKTTVSLYDLSGRLAWEYRGSKSDRPERIDVPAGLADGVFRVVMK